ncbi:MAG: hypothetical protein WKG07_25400 [Hymenobacter sp.]
MLPPFAGDMPCFADVDGDGYVDLLRRHQRYKRGPVAGAALLPQPGRRPPTTSDNAFRAGRTTTCGQILLNGGQPPGPT